MTTATVTIEDFSEPRYREPRTVPCAVASRVRSLRASGVRIGDGRDSLTFGVVSVLVEGETTPRDVSACRVVVDGAPLWPRRA